MPTTFFIPHWGGSDGTWVEWGGGEFVDYMCSDVGASVVGALVLTKDKSL